MMSRGSHPKLPFLALLALAIFFSLACQTPQPTPGRAAAPATPERAPSAPPSGPVHDLSQDEAEGGHTLRKHVGRTDDELRQRLRHERNIAAASTWTDRTTAEQAVGIAIAQNRDKISRWLDRPSRANLVLDYDGNPAHPIGRTLNRDADQTNPCSHAVIVLKRTDDRYFILTSYPECR
jgi:hypothetical protein